MSSAASAFVHATRKRSQKVPGLTTGENRALSVQRVECFASEALKEGKIVTISSLKAFLMLHSIFVRLIATP